MVKVDELNKYIDQFGNVSKKLDSISDEVKGVENIEKQQEELVEKFDNNWDKTTSRISDMEKLVSEKVALVDIKVEKIQEENDSINKKIGKESQKIKEEITDSKESIKDGVTKSKNSINDKISRTSEEIINEINKEISKVKKLQIATLISAVVTFATVILLHYL